MNRSNILIAGFAALLLIAAPAAAETNPQTGRLSIDSKISALIENPAAKAVLDKHFPGLKDNPHFEMIRKISIRDLAAHSQNLTPEALAKIEAELAAAQPAP